MSTISIPADALSQRRAALTKANEVRRSRAALRAELGAGIALILAALDDDRASTAAVYDVLLMIRGYGPYRVACILRRSGIPRGRRCQDLTIPERGKIIAEALR